MIFEGHGDTVVLGIQLYLILIYLVQIYIR